jgi:AraC-like DNA-binding protein
MLRASLLSVQRIAAECGYGSAVHFIRRFRMRFRTTPGRYRARG